MTSFDGMCWLDEGSYISFSCSSFHFFLVDLAILSSSRYIGGRDHRNFLIISPVFHRCNHIDAERANLRINIQSDKDLIYFYRDGKPFVCFFMHYSFIPFKIIAVASFEIPSYFYTGDPKHGSTRKITCAILWSTRNLSITVLP